MALVILPAPQLVVRIKFQRTNSSPLIKNIPEKGCSRAWQQTFFRDWPPFDSNHNVVVWLPVLDAKSTKTRKPFIQEWLRYGIWFQFFYSSWMSFSSLKGFVNDFLLKYGQRQKEALDNHDHPIRSLQWIQIICHNLANLDNSWISNRSFPAENPYTYAMRTTIFSAQNIHKTHYQPHRQIRDNNMKICLHL